MGFLHHALVAGVEFLSTIIEGALGLLQPFAQSGVSLDEIAQAIHQLLGQAEYQPLVLGLLVLHPGHVYHVEDGREVLLAGDEHLALEGLVPQRGVVGQRQLQRTLEGHEHEHEVHGLPPRVQVAAVVLARQLVHVFPHALYVRLQCLGLFLGVRSVHVSLVGRHGYLGVYHHVLPLWIMEDEVGTHGGARVLVARFPALGVPQVGLRLIVHALHQSLGGQEVSQDYLAHIARGLAIPAQHISQ